jgi:hypothetical protein
MRKELVVFIIQITIIVVIAFIILPGLNNKEVMLMSDPVQAQLTGFNNEIYHDGKNKTVKIEKLAEYEISAVVKNKRYYLFDSASEVSPMDFVLVWGELDSKAMDDSIKYSQSGRWYYYRYDCQSCVDGDYILKHSANVHIIPKNNEVLLKLIQVHKEDYITLKGYLVNVKFPDSDWKSSLTRNDTGNGACEIMYVESVTKHKFD